jgi:GAF domain-containing protein
MMELDSVLLNGEIREQTRTDDFMQTATLAMGRSGDLDETLTRLLGLALDLVNGDTAAILIDGEGDTLLLAAANSRGRPGQTEAIQKAAHFAASYPLAVYPQFARVMRERKPVTIVDTRCWADWHPWDGNISRSWLGVPILFGGRIHGVLSIASQHVSAFRPEDERLLEAMAAQTGILLENAKLSEQLLDANCALDNLTHELMQSKSILGRLEQELHDGTGQLLTVIKIELSLVYEELAEEDAKQRQRIEESMLLTDEIMDRLRRVVRE